MVAPSLTWMRSKQSPYTASLSPRCRRDSLQAFDGEVVPIVEFPDMDQVRPHAMEFRPRASDTQVGPLLSRML